MWELRYTQKIKKKKIALNIWTHAIGIQKKRIHQEAKQLKLSSKGQEGIQKAQILSLGMEKNGSKKTWNSEKEKSIKYFRIFESF